MLYLRDDDIPQAVEMGVADAGIVGKNEVAEKGMDVREEMCLGFGACRISLAVPRDTDYNGLQWFNGKRVATSYPRILKRFFSEKGIEAEVHEIAGSVEIAPAVGMADAIFDIVSSGGTLVQNGLREVENVFPSEAVLISNTELPEEKRAEIEKLKFRFRSIVDSRGMKYVLMNLPKNRLEEAVALLPGMREAQRCSRWPTLNGVVCIPLSEKTNSGEKIEQLKALGAEGILVLALENMIR